MEAVETLLLDREEGQPLVIPGMAYEEELLKAIPRFLNIQKSLGIAPPVFVMLSLLGVNGYIMGVSDSFSRRSRSYPIDRDDLIVPEIMLEDYDSDIPKSIRPAFDAIWNASGWPKSLNYNGDGKWAAHK